MGNDDGRGQLVWYVIVGVLKGIQERERIQKLDSVTSVDGTPR